MVEYKEEYANAEELQITLKDGILDGSDKEIIKTLNQKYHLDTNLSDEDAEDFQNLYYNADLRSFCGFIYEFPNVLIFFPEYYVPGFEDYFKQLIRDSEKITINRR